MALLCSAILSVSCCALLVGIARQLAPKGAAGEAVRLCGGILLLLSFTVPLLQLDASSLLPTSGGYGSALSAQREEYAQRYQNELSTVIAERAQTYIEDKAASLGLTVRAEVRVEPGEAAALTGAVLYGERSEMLTQWIEQELGIARGAQEWRE